MQLDEAASQGLVEGIALVVGSEVEVVQRGVGTAAVDRAVTSVHDHADIAGDALLRLLDELVQSTLEWGEPQAVVDQL